MLIGEAFNSCRTDILVLENPPPLPDVLYSDTHNWLSVLNRCKLRTDAFYDENLQLYLTVRLLDKKHEKNLDAPLPSYLICLLLGLQIDLEGFYTSSIPPPGQTYISQSFPPERVPSQFPPALAHSQTFLPNTPHPIPNTSPDDESYQLSQGQPFDSYSLRDRLHTSRVEGRVFTLLWDNEHLEWLAIYRLAIHVAYEANQLPQPLLCLTATITLREQQTPIPAISEALAKVTSFDVGGSSVNDQAQQSSSLTSYSKREYHEKGKNLLECLQTVDASERLYFPLARIAENRELLNRKLPTKERPYNPVMRKAHRKMLRPLTACHLQMFTALVPYMSTLHDSDVEEDLPRASEERTVILCLEIDCGGSDGHGFCIDSADVRIQGEGCKTKLVTQEDSATLFPLHISPGSQFSLVYAILFKDQLPNRDILNAAMDRFVLAPIAAQRAIAIEIRGRPCRFQGPEKPPESYLTFPFATRWNCTLDLNAIQIGGQSQFSAKLDSADNVLPIPPSPFPASSLHDITSLQTQRDERPGSLDKRSSRDKPLPPLNDRISSLIMERRASLRAKRQSRPATPENKSPRRPTSLQSTSSRYNLSIWSNTSTRNVIPSEPISASPFKVGQGDLNKSVLSPSPMDQNTGVAFLENKPRPASSLIISVRSVTEKGCTAPTIYPGHRFGLDIFIFNKSSMPCTLKLNFAANSPVSGHPVRPAFVPLENDVQVGPLEPGACQTIRLHLLALETGIHTIDNLTVENTESHHKMTLRSVAEVVIQGSDGSHS